MKAAPYLSLFIVFVALTACSKGKPAADPVKPVTVAKLAITIDVAGDTHENDAGEPNRTHLAGDFGGIQLEIAPTAPTIDQVKADGAKRIASRTGAPAPAALPNEKTETLPDGFVLTFGDDKVSYFVESYRTIGSRVVHCATEGNPLVRAQGEIAAACKTIKATK